MTALELARLVEFSEAATYVQMFRAAPASFSIEAGAGSRSNRAADGPAHLWQKNASNIAASIQPAFVAQIDHFLDEDRLLLVVEACK